MPLLVSSRRIGLSSANHGRRSSWLPQKPHQCCACGRTLTPPEPSCTPALVPPSSHEHPALVPFLTSALLCTRVAWTRAVLTHPSTRQAMPGLCPPQPGVSLPAQALLMAPGATSWVLRPLLPVHASWCTSSNALPSVFCWGKQPSSTHLWEIYGGNVLVSPTHSIRCWLGPEFQGSCFSPPHT